MDYVYIYIHYNIYGPENEDCETNLWSSKWGKNRAKSTMIELSQLASYSAGYPIFAQTKMCVGLAISPQSVNLC